MSLQKSEPVQAESKQQYTAACKEVQEPWCGIHEWWKAQQHIDRLIIKTNAVLSAFCNFVVTKWDFSFNAKLSAFPSVFVPIVTSDYNYESWAMTEREQPQVQAEEI